MVNSWWPKVQNTTKPQLELLKEVGYDLDSFQMHAVTCHQQLSAEWPASKPTYPTGVVKGVRLTPPSRKPRRRVISPWAPFDQKSIRDQQVFRDRSDHALLSQSKMSVRIIKLPRETILNGTMGSWQGPLGKAAQSPAFPDGIQKGSTSPNYVERRRRRRASMPS